METKNNIINNLIASLFTMVNGTAQTANMLGDNIDENTSTIKTLNVNIDSIRSQVVIIQQELDNYIMGV